MDIHQDRLYSDSVLLEEQPHKFETAEIIYREYIWFHVWHKEPRSSHSCSYNKNKLNKIEN